MATQFIFTGIVIAVIVQRLFELSISKRNVAYLLKQGGKAYGDNLLGIVKILQISWFLAMLVEVWLLHRPFIPLLAAVAFAALVVGQILRFLSMRALEWRWTLPIMTVPGLPVVNTGIYRYLQHPNWLGVILEIAALPLIHSAYLTAIAFSLANAWLMSRRMVAEEQALRTTTNHEIVFDGIPAPDSQNDIAKIAE